MHLFCKFLHENKVYRKNGVHHDEASGKFFKTVISDFLFLKFCHRDFSPQSNVKNDDFIKINLYQVSDKIVIYTLLCGGKSLWQSFKNKKSEMTLSKDFSLASSCCSPFFLQTMFSGRNLENKMDTFYCIESSIHFASILFCKFLHENKVYRKNGVHHDKASGKSFETVISDLYFWYFVTEIFHHKVMLKITILSKSWYNFLLFQETL